MIASCGRSRRRLEWAILSAESLEDAARWATRYIAAVEADEVDLRELEGGSPAEGYAWYAGI